MKPVRFAATALCTVVTSLSIGATVGALAQFLDKAGLGILFDFRGGAALAPFLEPASFALAFVLPALIASCVAAKLARYHEAASCAIAAMAAATLAAGYVLGPIHDGCLSTDVSFTATLGVAGAALVFMLLSFTSGFKGKYDTGAEHGDQRMAKMSEITSLSDNDYFFNNFIWSQNAHQCHIAYSSRLRKTQTKRNFNEITIGTSGMGKSYACVIPNLLNALGDAPEPLPSDGVRVLANVIEHARARRNGDMFLDMSPEAVLNERAGSYDGIGERLKATYKQKAGLGAGWDVFHTDPKGDNVRAVGALYEAVGVDMRLFNTVDFDGNCYNPLADRYIRPHMTDVRDVAELTCTVTIESESTDGSADRRSFPITSISHTEYAEKEPVAMNVGAARLCAQGRMAYRQRITMADLEGYSWEEINEHPDSENNDDAAAPTVKYLEWDTGTLYDVVDEDESDARVKKCASAQDGDNETMKLLRRQTYRKTRSYYDITVSNLLSEPDSMPCDFVLTIKLDECQILDRDSMTVTYTDHDTAPTVAANTDKLDDEGIVALTVKGLEGWGAIRISFEADTATFRVPDGVQLAKTVECLVANLKHADAPSGNNDPFWDECKRLCFMSLCSAAYEMYEREEDRNLNTVARLLDMAAPEEGGWDQMTPLAYLMKRWETGKDVVEAEQRDEDASIENAFKPRFKATGSDDAEWRRDGGRTPHSRTSSLAVNCYRAYSVGAEDTVRSVIITCKAAFVSLFTPEIKKMIAKDEMRLDELGEKGRRQAIFVVTKDTNSPYDFLTALLVYQTIDVLLDKAYAAGGKLTRHVRFELDESMTIGKIPILDRALAVVRSRNISVALYMQSKFQCQERYGENAAKSIFENVSVIKYLGSNSNETNNELSEIIGDETIYSCITNRSWSGAVGVAQVSESVQSQARKVRSAASLRQMNREKMVALASGLCAIEDEKFHTSEHPYFPYVYSDFPRPLNCPVARVRKPFEFADYNARRDAEALRAKEGRAV